MGRKIIKPLILILSFLFSFTFCSKKEEKAIESIIEDVVQQYSSIDFSEFHNLEISFRERGFIRDAIYVSTVSNDSCLLDKENINPTLSWSCGIINYGGILSVQEDDSSSTRYKDGISDDSLKFIVRSFLKLNLDYLKVDCNNNVYLSPPSF